MKLNMTQPDTRMFIIIVLSVVFGCAAGYGTKALENSKQETTRSNIEAAENVSNTSKESADETYTEEDVEFDYLGFILAGLSGLLFLFVIQYLTKDDNLSRMERIMQREKDDEWYEEQMKKSAEILRK